MRRLSWLLWLLIALMPVRGIAQSLMVGGAFGHGASVASMSSSAEAPCPMHAAGALEAAAADAPTLDATAAGDNPTQHTCGLCNVCHSAVLPLTPAAVVSDTLHDAVPLPAWGLGAGRAAPSELFRPPR